MSNRQWENIWQQVITNETVKEEYKKAFLLNMFQKICAKMNRDDTYKSYVQKIFLQTSNTLEVTISLIKKEFDYQLNEDDAEMMLSWFQAYRRKQNQKRKTIPIEIKKDLYSKQNGLCATCGEPLGDDWSKIHVDHIIPFVLVGDELPNNYQDLCETCNGCKSSKTDFVFKSIIKLT